MLRINLIIFCLFFTLFGVFSQSINMSNGSTNTCSGNFYDNGGSGSNYSNSQTLVYTICPNTAGSKVIVNFTSFDLENNYDFLDFEF